MKLKFLVLAVLLLGIIGCKQSESVIELQDSDEILTYSEAERLALELGRLHDLFEYELTEPNDAVLYAWSYELLPMFQYEGAVRQTRAPRIIEFKAERGGARHNHIAGHSDCRTFVKLNARYKNPASHWYGKNWLTTLTHELAHIQQQRLCLVVPSQQLETSAEIVALETLASLANKGNYEAAYALVDTLRGSVMSSAQVLAEREGRMDEFHELRRQVAGDEWALADSSWKKSMRFWADKQQQLMAIQERYRLLPMQKIFASFKRGNIVRLAIIPSEYADTMYNEEPGVEFYIEDIRYFLENAEEMIVEMNKAKAEDLE